jgi:signal transduction histidine kinase/ActR/RegA family two-component response regulator
MFDLAEAVAPVEPETPGSVVFRRFEADPDLLNIAVVDADGAPVGLIERNAFALKMAAQYGRALYAGRPVNLLMDAEPKVVDGATPIIAFTNDSLLESAANLLRGFIVTRDGRYAGVGSALSLLQAQNVSIRYHANEAQAASRAKSEFLAVMSHEIRTPLNGVLALAEVMDRQLRQEELRPYVGTIIQSGQTLLRLLNDALDLSRAEAGRLELQEDSFRVADLVDDIEALWSARAAEAGLQLVVSLDSDGDLWALGDVVRLKQVLNNLIGNALKFTAAGVVEVRLKAHVHDVYVTLVGEVRDTGAGIAAEEIDGLFTPFSQTDSGRKAGGGTGLGLSICRQLVEKMDGFISVESNVGRGSTFAFEVVLYQTADPGLRPAAPSAPSADGTARAGQGECIRVLIADDNATNRMVAETLCRMFDCDCESVEDGAQAVERARDGAFDLILMDIKMPVMDGMEAARRIRGLPGPVAGLPIIALTANADPFDAESYMAQGMDAVVEKPIKPDLLLAAMNRLLDRRAQEVAA